MEAEINSKVHKFIINTPIRILSVCFVSLLISFATSHDDTTDHVVGFVFRRSDTGGGLGWNQGDTGGGGSDTDTDTGEGSAGWQFPRLDNSQVSRDSSFVQRRRQKCSNKFQIPHGKKRILEQGSLVRFRCDNGYIVFGATVAACVNGKWSEPTPVCIAGGCRRPPISAGITGRALFGGAAIVFGCSPGFRMVGENILVCNGIRWNGTAPSCQRLTPPPATTTLTTTTTTTTKTTTTLPPPLVPATEKEESTEVDDNLGEDPSWQLQTWPWSQYGTSSEPAAGKQEVDGSSTNSYQENEKPTIQTIPEKNYSLQETGVDSDSDSGNVLKNQTPNSSVILKISTSPSASDPTASISTAVPSQKITTAEIGTVTLPSVPDPTNRIPENTETVHKISSILTSANKPTTSVTVPISTTASKIVTEFPISNIPLHFPASQTQSSQPTTTTTTTATTTTTTRRYPTRQRRPTVTTKTTTATTTSNPRRSNSTLLLSNRTQSFRPPKFPFIPIIRTIPTRLPTRIPKIRCLLLPANLRASCMNLTGISPTKFSNKSTAIFPARTPPGRSYNLTANNGNNSNTFVFPSWNFSKNRSSFYSNTTTRGRNFTYNIKPFTLPTQRPREKITKNTTEKLTTTAALQMMTTTAKEFSHNESSRKLSVSPGTPGGGGGGWSSSATTQTTLLEFDNTLHQILQRENKEKERIKEIEDQKSPKHELITPFKLDTERNIHNLQHGTDGNSKTSSGSFFLVLGSILSTCAVGLAVGVVGYYFWRRNKGISRRSSTRDSDGENLPVHLDVEEEFVYFGNNRW